MVMGSRPKKLGEVIETAQEKQVQGSNTEVQKKIRKEGRGNGENHTEVWGRNGIEKRFMSESFKEKIIKRERKKRSNRELKGWGEERARDEGSRLMKEEMQIKVPGSKSRK